MHAQYTFETFISGPSNAQALSLARAAAKAPGNAAHSPLYLWGPVSTGKTHLLYAIGNRLAQTAPEKKVLCIDFDQFIAELIQSICRGYNESFRKKYSAVDVLLVDDVHFSLGKEATQQEFLQTLDLFLQNGRQIVLTSACPVEELPVLDAALSFRQAYLLLPDLQERINVAAAKAAQYGLTPGDAVLHYLARRGENVRQIEGALKLILVHRDLLGMEENSGNMLKLLAEEWLPRIQKSPQ